jgi:glycosyltransferase involved in cell wall biosynthesis
MKIMVVGNKPNISFGIQLQYLIRGLKEIGNEVLFVDHLLDPKKKIIIANNFKPELLLVWTFFHDIGHPTISVEEIKKIQSMSKPMVVGFEVSDTTRLSDKAFRLVEDLNPDILLTPSRWSKEAFGKLLCPVEVLPHALSPTISEGKYIKMNHVDLNYKGLKKVMLYSQHSPERKGYDIALYVADKISKEYNNVKFFSKIKMIDPSSRDIVVPILGFMTEELLYSYYNSMDYFLYPVRGGAYEIPVLEMLALGKTVIIPSDGAWTDIPLSKDDVYWIKTNGYIRIWKDNPYHVGYMVNVDKEDAYEKMKYALENKKEVNRGEYVKEYHYKRITERFLEIIKK